MIYVYYTRIGDNVCNWKYPCMNNSLSSRRLERINACANLSKRSELAISEMLLMRILAKYGVSFSDLLYNDYGKPYLPESDFHFNVSHSGAYVCCAVCTQNIGIDVENIKNRNINSIERFISQEDFNYILSSENKLDKLYEIWTKYEAFLKCIGVGWARKVVFEFNKGNRSRIAYYRDGKIPSENEYHVITTTFQKNYILSVCCENSICEYQLIEIDIA